MWFRGANQLVMSGDLAFPAAPGCVAEGADVAITVYPDAPHAFEAVGATITYLPNVLDGSACRRVLKAIDDAPRAPRRRPHRDQREARDAQRLIVVSSWG